MVIVIFTTLRELKLLNRGTAKKNVTYSMINSTALEVFGRLENKV